MTEPHQIGLDLAADGTGRVSLDGMELNGTCGVEVKADPDQGSTVVVIALRAAVTGAMEAAVTTPAPPNVEADGPQDQTDGGSEWRREKAVGGVNWINIRTGEKRFEANA